MGVTLEFPPEELKKLKDQLSRWQLSLINPLEDGVRGAAKAVAAEMKKNAPYQSFVATIRPDKDIIRTDNEISIRVRSENPSSHLFEFGTGIFHKSHGGRERATLGMIEAKTGDPMYFKPDGLDHVIAKWQVKGMESKPFVMKSALTTVKEQLREYQKALLSSDKALSYEPFGTGMKS